MGSDNIFMEDSFQRSTPKQVPVAPATPFKPAQKTFKPGALKVDLPKWKMPADLKPMAMATLKPAASQDLPVAEDELSAGELCTVLEGVLILGALAVKDGNRREKEKYGPLAAFLAPIIDDIKAKVLTCKAYRQHLSDHPNPAVEALIMEVVQGDARYYADAIEKAHTPTDLGYFESQLRLSREFIKAFSPA